MNINDVNEIEKEISKKTNKGFGFFIKNVGMLLLIFIAGFILTNPECIIDPVSFFKNFNTSSLWVALALFCTFGGIYQFGKSLQKEERNEYKEQRINEVEEAMRKKDIEDKKHHNDLVERRFEIGPRIANELKDLLIRLNADRAAIMEFHNGTYNASGLPFVYGDMVYEEVSPNVPYASDEFKNFNLSKLPFVALHYKEKTWIGSVDDVEKDDPYFAAKLRVVKVNWGIFVILEGINGPLGFLTLFFKNDENHPDKKKVIAEVTHSAQILSTLLDKIKE